MDKALSKEELNTVLSKAKKESSRDYLLLLLSYRHGLRSEEVTLLRYSFIDGDTIFIPRVKGGKSLNHPLALDEKRLILKHQRNNNQDDNDLIFPITTRHVRRICNSYGINHHRLRYTCAKDLTLKGINVLTIRDYLGHVKTDNTLDYMPVVTRKLTSIPKWY